MFFSISEPDNLQLNPQSRYLKIDAYLVSHDSDIKLSHHFLLTKVINIDAFLKRNSFRKQSVNAGETSTVEYISLQTVFILI